MTDTFTGEPFVPLLVSSAQTHCKVRSPLSSMFQQRLLKTLLQACRNVHESKVDGACVLAGPLRERQNQIKRPPTKSMATMPPAMPPMMGPMDVLLDGVAGVPDGGGARGVGGPGGVVDGGVV